MTENNTPRARKSHVNCDHPATKVARAKCRRAMKKSLDMTAPAATETVMTVDETTTISLEEFFAATAITRAVADLPLMIEAAPSTAVTKKNFRIHKSETARIEFVDGEIETGKITGWGDKMIQFVTAAGKLRRVDAPRVARVFV